MSESITTQARIALVSKEAEPILLEPGSGILPKIDRRRRVPEPPPVRVVAVDNVRLPAQTGLERELDHFYVDLLRFERDADQPERIIYDAENVSIQFELVEGLIERDSVRPTGIEIPSLSVIEHALIDEELEFLKQKGLSPGQQSILVPDPAGNWIEVMEIRAM